MSDGIIELKANSLKILFGGEEFTYETRDDALDVFYNNPHLPAPEDFESRDHFLDFLYAWPKYEHVKDPFNNPFVRKNTWIEKKFQYRLI